MLTNEDIEHITTVEDACIEDGNLVVRLPDFNAAMRFVTEFGDTPWYFENGRGNNVIAATRVE